MADWVMPLFVIVVGVALFMQMLIFAAMFMAIRRLSKRMGQIADQFQGRLFPLISQLEAWMEEAQPRISSVIYDAAEITQTARYQVERADRIITDTADRLRMRLVHADQILTGTFESIEETSSKIRRTVRAPVRSVTALFRGIQTGFDFYRRRRRQTDDDSAGDWAPPLAETHRQV
jgi:hypothetical protein